MKPTGPKARQTGMNQRWCVEVRRRAHDVSGQVMYLATPMGNLRPGVRKKPSTSTYLSIGFWVGGLEWKGG